MYGIGLNSSWPRPSTSSYDAMPRGALVVLQQQQRLDRVEWDHAHGQKFVAWFEANTSSCLCATPIVANPRLNRFGAEENVACACLKCYVPLTPSPLLDHEGAIRPFLQAHPEARADYDRLSYNGGGGRREIPDQLYHRLVNRGYVKNGPDGGSRLLKWDGTHLVYASGKPKKTRAPFIAGRTLHADPAAPQPLALLQPPAPLQPPPVLMARAAEPTLPGLHLALLHDEGEEDVEVLEAEVAVDDEEDNSVEYVEPDSASVVAVTTYWSVPAAMPQLPPPSNPRPARAQASESPSRCFALHPSLRGANPMMAQPNHEPNNLKRKLEELMTCPICRDTVFKPIVTPCQHIFCEPCIQQHLQQHLSVREERNCPVCRTRINSASRDLKQSSIITQLAELVSASD